MSLYTATFSKSVPGLDFIDRSSEGFLDFHYGRSFDKSVTPLYDCGPYTVDILKDGAPFKTVNIPNHFWASNWWIELTPVTVTRTPEFLISNGYVPPFGETGINMDWGIMGELKFPGPMGMTPGNAGWEPMTGGRAGIGIATLEAATYLVKRDASDMLEQAKSGATQPIWYWDESTGKVIDLIAKPRTTSYWSQAQGGAPNWLGPWPVDPTDKANPATYNSNQTPQPSTPDTAHMEDLGGIAALVTGAPRYLRWLQMRVVKGFNEDAYWVGGFGEQVTIFRRQMRGTAWLARELFYCYWATFLAEQQGPLPADLLSSAHFKQIIDNQRAQFTQFVKTDDVFKIFGILGGRQVALWQCDQVNQVLGLFAAKWPDEWGGIYIDTLRNLMARVNGDGKKQWPPAFPTWYWGMVGDDASSGEIAPYAGGWAELRDKWFKSQVDGTALDGNNGQISAANVSALNADPTNGLTFVPQDSEYLCWTYGALAYAVHNDRNEGPLKGKISAAFPRLEAAFSDYHSMMKKLVNTNTGHFIPQCSISVAPKPPVVIPPIDPPPTGEIEVPDPVFNAPFTATAAFKDNKGNPMVPDTVSWNAPTAFALTQDQTDKLKAHGVYGAEGAANITAIGVKDGVSVTVTKGVTVPAAAPFLATGEITLS